MDEEYYVFPKVTDENNDNRGITLRDYFASQALNGLISNPKYFSCDEGMILEENIFKRAYSMADAMINERKKQL